MVNGRVLDADSPLSSPALALWADRQREAPSDPPFQRHDVLMALRAIHAPDRRLTLAIGGGDAAGAMSILPCSFTRRRVGPLPFRLIEGPVGYHASAVDFALSGGARSDHATAVALLASDGWDLLEFRGVAADSALARAFSATDCAIVTDHDAHAVPLDGGPIMSTKRRRNLRRLLRRHETVSGGTITEASPAEPDWPDIIQAYAALHTARWQGTSTPSSLADPDVRQRFSRVLGGRGGPAGLFAVVLRTGGAISGVVLAWDDSAHVHAWRLAYDVALAPISPGLQLLQHLAEVSASRGRSLMHLGRGDDEYKQSWTTTRVPQVIVRAVSASARVRLAASVGRLFGRAPFAGWRR
ncbi:MAG TPA: GNAT family N-acetyltransferase [Gemmatimonadales bacterium]|nr:GNAT family N-acetyltransferase [Gemmatimonadales bacterium]